MNPQIVMDSLRQQVIKYAGANRKYVYDIMMTTYQKSVRHGEDINTKLKSLKKSKTTLELNADSKQSKITNNPNVSDVKGQV